MSIGQRRGIGDSEGRKYGYAGYQSVQLIPQLPIVTFFILFNSSVRRKRKFDPIGCSIGIMYIPIEREICNTIDNFKQIYVKKKVY